MIDKLLIAQTTKDSLNQYLAAPTHALLITGTSGQGLKQVADSIAKKMAGLSPEKSLGGSALVLDIRPNKNNNISIEEIREAWRYSRVAPPQNADKKVVYIHFANYMTLPAQNSILKLLEEPPQYLYFVLTSPSPKALLPTVLSRVQHVSIKSPSKKTLEKFLTDKYQLEEADIRRIMMISSSEAYKAIDVLEGRSEEGMSQAKAILSMNPYERMTFSKDLISDRNKALNLVQKLYHLLYIATKTAVGNQKDYQSWIKRLKVTEQTIDNLESNGHVRLNMMNLFVNL